LKRLSVLSVGLLMLVQACGPSPQQQAAMTATALTAIAAAWTPTPTVTITSTPSSTSTVTLTPTSTRKPTNTITPSPTDDPARFYAPDHTFSLVLPEGWRAVDQGYDYPTLVGPRHDMFIDFFVQEGTGGISFYSALIQDAMLEVDPSTKTISEDFLENIYQKEYFRWAFTFVKSGTGHYRVIYFFDAKEHILVISYGRVQGQNGVYDANVDEAMKTIQFHD
jgi:hypothetical protein